ncbi:MAG: CARDB domain-containing protein, partial [Halobacteriaceae archaeon]
TDNVPQVWSQQQHSKVFAIEPPKLAIELGSRSFSISGPYRNKTQSTVPTIFTGETIEISLRVTNTGSIGGTFTIPFEVDNEIVDQVNVYLEPGETKTISVSEAFQQPGLYQIHIKSITKELRVLSPVSPTIATFTASKSTVTPGTSVTITLEFANPTSNPARKTYSLTLDGNIIFQETITLQSGETTSYSVTVSLNETGKHVFAIGDKSFTVTVRNTTSPDPTETTTTTGQPGYTILLSVISIGIIGILYLMHGKIR